MYSIKAFEGARGTSHRLHPIYNTIVLDGADRSETTYGWEGTEYVSPRDPSVPMVFLDVMDSANRQYQDVKIIMPSGTEYTWSENRWLIENYPTKNPIPREVVSLRDGKYPSNRKACKYLNQDVYASLRCAVRPELATCHQCTDYEVQT